MGSSLTHIGVGMVHVGRLRLLGGEASPPDSLWCQQQRSKTLTEHHVEEVSARGLHFKPAVVPHILAPLQLQAVAKSKNITVVCWWCVRCGGWWRHAKAILCTNNCKHVGV